MPAVTGRFAVACSNVEQDFSRLRAGESAPDYWEGNHWPTGRTAVTDLLLSPANALTYQVAVPTVAQFNVFERQAASSCLTLQSLAIPMTTANTRADYVLPSGVMCRRCNGRRGAL